MNAKRYVVALVSALALMPCWTMLDAEPVIFFFSGQITERRAQNRVFTQPNTDQFYGYFSYDTAATAISFGYYPLLSFGIDGNSLNFSNGTGSPFIPGVIILGAGLPGPAHIEIRGFYLPAAAADPADSGSTALVFTDFTGTVLTDYNLPTSLSLSSFGDAGLIGPDFISGAAPPTFDRGTITQLTQVPEPATCGLMGLGLLAAFCRKRRPTQFR